MDKKVKKQIDKTFQRQREFAIEFSDAIMQLINKHHVDAVFVIGVLETQKLSFHEQMSKYRPIKCEGSLVGIG